ncbi:TPA: DUF4935 domain-containing protein [Stenotrophomonas maltophilia]|nr:DUF4935 domain-containing protein [Stenotrophomonas maltophilia]
MRSQFSGYFDPTEQELDALWLDGAIALDTNVLLGLYRMPAATRKEIFDLLSQVQARLWVPYHVLVEFHRNRLDVMRAEFAASKELGKEARNAYDAFKAVVSEKRVKERACWPELSKKLSELNEKAEELFKVTKSESDHYISPNAQDTVLPFVESLLQGRIGARPSNQREVDLAEEQASLRYQVKMGPGFLDQEKAGDKYMFDGLIYDRQFGDYMVWRELLGKGKPSRARRLMLVTSDVKADWWLDTKSISGKRPQPELVMEMRRSGNTEVFWMYTLSEFIENAKRRMNVQVTEKAITDARQAEVSGRRESQRHTVSSEFSEPPVSIRDLQYLIDRFTNGYREASPNLAFGLSKKDDGVLNGVVVVSANMGRAKATPIFSRVRAAVKSLASLGELGLIDIYVVFPFAPKSPDLKWISQLSISDLPTGMPAPFRLFAGHFMDAERLEYRFENVFGRSVG